MQHPATTPSSKSFVRRLLSVPVGFCSFALTMCAASAPDPTLPNVPPGFTVQLIAREPLVRNPCAMAFDTRGRLFVGQGPQYRNPKPDTPGDTIEILIDTDGDGVMDKAKTFARGLNCVQGLAWHGRDLWVANAPDLTIVRDLDGDDEADEYVRVYTDLGNIEHALHGLNWAPDGKLYMSKGTSKGLTQPGRIAPKAFRELWGVSAPAGTPDLPEPPRVFNKADYKNTYHDPRDDWGKEGGLLRCDDLGANLEIVSRGMRNPWDAGYDHGFNWLTTDNDQYDGDRIMMPFYGAHFGWAHAWSADWAGANHLPTVPVSGPVFPGSGTGKVYVDSPAFPASHRGVWFINDWLRKTIFVYRPVWDGALLQPEGGKWEEFAVGRTALFQPVDIEIGPDEALYVTGWGKSYGAVYKDGQQVNEGRIFRIAPATLAKNPGALRPAKPHAQWSAAELVKDLGSPVSTWRSDAQDELVRRGAAIMPELTALLERGAPTTALETWSLWTLGRMTAPGGALDEWLATKAPALSLNARLQALRIAAYRVRRSGEAIPLPTFVVHALGDAEARVRFEAVQAIWQARQKPLADQLWALTATETDRATFYSAWQALRELTPAGQLKQYLTNPKAGVRRAALLALLEDDALEANVVGKLIADPDAQTAGIAALWQAKRSGNTLILVEPAPKRFTGELKLRMLAGIKPAALRWTTDGSEPPPPKAGQRQVEGQTLTLKETTKLKVALFVEEDAASGDRPYKKIGPTVEGTWTRVGDTQPLAPLALEPPPQPLTVESVTPLAEEVFAATESTAMEGGKFEVASNPKLVRGQRLFTAAGCMACHRVGDEGQTFGPDLTAMGDKADAKHIIESIIEPDAIIAEGFALQVVTTTDGKSYSGIFRDETNRMLTLVQADGQPVSVEKAVIAQREQLHQSIMPSFAQAMSAAQMADLAAWMLSQRSQALQKTLSLQEFEKTQTNSTTPPVPAAATGLAVEVTADRVVVSDGGRVTAAYVFSDPQILRPGWQNVRAPSGAAITRVHPPAAPEAVDHATMHPGIWFALGEVSGADFWRNKGRIEHQRFIEAPALRGDSVSFRSVNRLVSPSGETLAELELGHRFSRQGNAYLLTLEAKLFSASRDLVFGDQEEMGFGVRLTAPLIEKNGGRVVNSNGAVGAKEAWGKVADWCAYDRNVAGRVQGAAVFASPANPHRSWWHTRDYGLVVANAFGAKAQPAIPEGRLTLPRGTPLVLRYAVLLFDTPSAESPDFAAQYRSLLAEKIFQP